MLIACIRLLASNDNEERQESRQGAGRSVDVHSQTPTISRRAAWRLASTRSRWAQGWGSPH